MSGKNAVTIVSTIILLILYSFADCTFFTYISYSEVFLTLDQNTKHDLVKFIALLVIGLDTINFIYYTYHILLSNFTAKYEKIFRYMSCFILINRFAIVLSLILINMYYSNIVELTVCYFLYFVFSISALAFRIMIPLFQQNYQLTALDNEEVKEKLFYKNQLLNHLPDTVKLLMKYFVK